MSDKDDCISRQAAIDAMKDMYRAAEKWLRDATDDVTKARAESCMASLVEIKLRIEKIPVVQPDHVADIGKKVSISKVIRCKDCKFAHITNDGRYCKYCDMFTDDYGQLIEMYFDSNFYCGYAERRTECN